MESPVESFTVDMVTTIWLDYNLSASTSPSLNVRKSNIAGIAIAYTVVLLIITTNVISLVAFAVEKKLRTYNNYFIINLVLSDLLTGISGIVLCLYVTYDLPFLTSKGFCLFFNGIRQCLPTVSNLGMVAICYDRYRATHDPIRHFTSRSKRRAVIMSAVVWAISVGFWYTYDLAWYFVVPVKNSRRCIPSYSYSTVPTIVPIALTVFLPLAVVSILYFKIYRKIQTSFRGRNVTKQFKNTEAMSTDTVSEENTMDGTGDQTVNDVSNGMAASTRELSLSEVFSEDKDIISRRISATTKAPPESLEKITMKKSTYRESTTEMRRATRTLLFIIIAFCVTWIPRSTLDVIYAINPTLLYFGGFTLYRYIGWLTFANSFLNPITYVASQLLFRKTVMRILCHPISVCSE